jgi:hypothetical protein
MNLPPRSRRDRAIRRTIRDTLERLRYSRQLERNLVRSVRPLQHHDPLPAVVKRSAKRQPDRDEHAHHKHIVTCNRETSTCDSNHMIREQRFLPAGSYGKFGRFRSNEVY